MNDKHLKKYKNTFYYYIEDNSLWVEDNILPGVFIKIADNINEKDIEILLNEYYQKFSHSKPLKGR